MVMLGIFLSMVVITIAKTSECFVPRVGDGELLIVC